MSRAFRLLPILLLVWILIAFAWRLIQPPDPRTRRQHFDHQVRRLVHAVLDDVPPFLCDEEQIRLHKQAGGKQGA